MQSPVDNDAVKLEAFVVAPEKFPGCCVIRFLKLLTTSFMVKAISFLLNLPRGPPPDLINSAKACCVVGGVHKLDAFNSSCDVSINNCTRRNKTCRFKLWELDYVLETVVG